MNPQELRLGNYVLFEGKLTQITLQDFATYLDTNPEKYQPVELTKKWFVFFGYEVDEYENQTDYGDWWSDWIDDGNKIYPKPYYFADGFDLPEGIKYVHQLQNICFACTGRELEAKELATP